MSDVKQVKVDNWGIYFLQRLKHFFNRTDYCDLTLQFQDNAQLKVHRLVLNACTEYFEILERTCEMYEDCLVMPDDLQADVVVPIVNFMYTGQLEFRMEALDKLYQTSLVMNMPVLSKLLEAHRGKGISFKSKHSKSSEIAKQIHSPSFSSSSAKRSYTKAFDSSKSVTKTMEVDKLQVTKSMPRKVVTNNDNSVVYREKKYHQPINKTAQRKDHRAPSPLPLDSSLYNKKLVLGDPRPTRYELPEELDTDNVFDNSFSNISYTSQPLMVHPETTKQYSAKKSNLFNEPTSSKRAYVGSTVDIVECKKISKKDNIFDENVNQSISYDDVYSSAFLSVKDDPPKDTNQLFDQILDNNEGTKVTIESKDKLAGNLDHAKIISEVLKKYPHLVKSNKNIKLKILNTPSKTKKPRPIPNPPEEKEVKLKQEVCYTYETDVLDSKEAAKLIAMGAENIKGPWICLICGTPGRALNFTSYYNFRRHLVEVHQEKAVSTICEYCGLKSHKRNYLLHHIYTKHGVPPPPHYHFPKCNMCDYIALTEGFLVKHKLTHTDERKPIRCSLCFATFSSTNLLLWHIQKTGHKQDRKMNMQCNYCMRVFMRDSNYFAHIKTSHKEQALKDGIIEDSDDDNIDEKPREMRTTIKYELPIETGFEDMQYHVQKRNEGNVHAAKKAKISVSNQKILNPGFSTPVAIQSQKVNDMSDDNNEYIQEDETPANAADNVMVLNENEYIMKDNQIIARKSTMKPSEYIISDFIETEPEQNIENLNTVNPTTSMQYTDLHHAEIIQQPKMVLKKSANISQPIQIVVSNEEEYKALMASNHSIIFDDGDPNKTLTVLTAAQNPTLNATTIDLDNNQSNDMMIIQDEYPMNVSESVAADNSKYVVVYSHAMEHDDPNKQYQIITSQELSAQYVQSSAVIAQNFETITTTTPVVRTTVIDTQMEETWPQSSHPSVENQAHVQVASENELQNINETVSTNITQIDIEAGLSVLPEVELTKMVGVSEQIQDNVEQPNSIHLETVPADIPEPISVIEENQLGNTVAMDIHPSEMTQIESVSDKVHTITEEAEMGNEHEITCPSDTYENVDIVQEQQNPLPMSAEEQSSEEIIEECNSVPETENNDSIEHTLNIVEDVPTSEENTVAEEMPVKSIIAPVEAKKQIQNLTSEWSEDEYDNVPNSVAETGTEESELEESIENINKEVQKQITDKEVVTTEEFIATETKEPEMVLETANAEATQEKISSLLNDWEDSQEEAIVDNDEKPTESVETDLIDTNGTDSKHTHTEQITSLESDAKDSPKKDDKIKSLVSDWDDEEEETKE